MLRKGTFVQLKSLESPHGNGKVSTLSYYCELLFKKTAVFLKSPLPYSFCELYNYFAACLYNYFAEL